MLYAPMMTSPLQVGLMPCDFAIGNASKVQKQSRFLLPPIDLLFLDRPFDAEDVFLVHKMSYGRYKLLAGDWFWEFHAQGFAFAVDANDQLDCVCAEDVFKRQVCRRDGQLCFLYTKQAALAYLREDEEETED